jgi:hypothetical protein
VVYVLAAYSITISVLAIYGVLLQHRVRVTRARVAGRSGGPAALLGQGFNLGAALLAPLWAWFHGLRAAGATLLLTSVVLGFALASGLRGPVWILAAVLAVAAVVLGVVGNRVAAGQTGADPEALLSRELRWALAGAVLHTLVLPWACYFLIGGD